MYGTFDQHGHHSESPKGSEDQSEADAISVIYSATCIKRRLTSSLHWYVNHSLTDMLEDFMLSDEAKGSMERQQILSEIVDLPISFDETSRQLLVTQVLEAVQRYILVSKGKCMELITGLFRRLDPKKSEVSGLLLRDFEILVDHIYFKDVDGTNKVDNDEDPCELKPPASKSDSEKLKEALAYTKILIKIFRLGFFRNKKVPILVVLNKLSIQEPNSYFANILIYILKEVGPSIIDDMKRGVDKCNFWSTFSMMKSKDKEPPTIDNVLKRLSSFYEFLPESSEALSVVKTLVDERRKNCELLNGRRTRNASRDRAKPLNGGVLSESTDLNRLSDVDEASTAL